MGSTLVAGQRVHLVHDDRLHALQHLARRRSEHEVERLRRGDEDVRRIAHDLAALVGRGVARAHGRADLGRLRARLLRPGPRQLRYGRKGPLQVAVHVGAEGLQRRHIQHAHAPGPLLPRRGCARLLGHEGVDGPQERRQRLARARRRDHERVLAPRDGLPRPRLHLGRLAQCSGEPRARGLGEHPERGRFPRRAHKSPASSKGARAAFSTSLRAASCW